MRRIVPLAAIALAASSLVPGCSLTGLDRFDWPGCDECDVLNARDGIDPASACELWRCDPQTLECRFGERDRDGDQHAPIACGGDDCDDAVATAYPGASEICNSADDDCNGWIDDVSAEAAAPTAILAAPAAPRWLSSAPWQDGLLTAYQTEGGAGLEQIDDLEPITAGEPLVLATSAPPYAASSAAVVEGCANAVQSSHPLPLCEGGACPAGQECVMSRGGPMLCDEPLASAPVPGKCHHDAECDDGVFCNGREACEPASPSSDEFGCRANVANACSASECCIEAGRICESVSPSATPCRIADAAITSVGDDEWIAAAITDAGCAAGSLRLGYFVSEPRAPESRYPVRRIVQRGDANGTRSTSWLGIDVSASQRCPGPATGRAPGAPTGVAGQAIAGLPANPDAGRLRPQALVAYLAGPLCRALGTCGTDPPMGATGPLDVELVGVWLEEGSAGGAPVGWTNAASSGEPVRLGASTGAGATRVAVSAWSSDARAGYVVAYPREGGGVAVHVVPAMSDPAEQCPSPERPCTVPSDCEEGEVCNMEMGRCQLRPCVSGFDPRATQLGTQPRITPALDVPAATTQFASAAITGDVRVAVGRTLEGGAIELGLAWVEASGVAVARATLDPASGALTEGSIERFAAGSVGDLAIAHVGEGIVRPGAEIGGEAVPETLRGGFVVTWRSGDETRGVRIADLDGSVVAPGAVVAGAGAVQPRAFVDRDARLRVLAHANAQLVVLPALCGPVAR